ncbi:MAG: hypothetical protein AUI83_19550 [Armatimonadetes bacterium 13_1_40CM_3_65_7]|nr:MAG: hypothetical protein AUI83_19550 [Armatimonadetes bacterium 13_1_40CM_3_65_7]
MANDAQFHKVRWHVTAKSLGVSLPPGYHLLEAPLQLFLYYGDQEIARFAPGTDPKVIQQEAAANAGTRQPQHGPAAGAVEDPITALPWSVSLRGEAVMLAGTSDLHVIVVHLDGLDTLMDVYGYKAAHSVLRQISRRMARLMDTRDRFTRHSGDKLLIFTVRPLDEIRTLVEMIHQQVQAASLESDGDRLPHSRIGVATVDRLTDPNAAPAVIDAVIISAEVASTGASDAAGQIPTSPEPAVPVPHKFQAGGADEPAPAAEPEPAAELEPAAVEREPEEAVMPPAPPSAPRRGLEPEPVAADDEDMPLGLPADDEETDEPVYRLPANETMAPSPEPPLAADDEETAADTEEPPAGEEIAPPAPAVPVSTTDGAGRIRFKGASLDVSGLVATATVKLVHGDREVVGRAVGRNAQERRLFLAAEAAARAVTEFLPQGYGIVVHDIQPAPPEVGKALWAVVLFLTPTGEESLLGIAPIDDMAFEAASKAVLNAVNRRVGLLLGSPA